MLHEEPLATVYANDDGTVPLEGVAALTEARARRTRIADLRRSTSASLGVAISRTTGAPR